MSALLLRQVRVTCNLCGQSCQTYVSAELADDWAERWAVGGHECQPTAQETVA